MVMRKEGTCMFTFFNSESLWMGTDLQVFSHLRAVLKANQIPYKHKVSDQMYQYEIFVYKKDLEKARYLIRQ